jgi:hypothetical protein
LSTPCLQGEKALDMKKADKMLRDNEKLRDQVGVINE